MPPCARNMDLMIEAKDKEQALFELMRNFRLPGFNTFSDIIPHVRVDENKVTGAGRKKKGSGGGESEVLVVPEDEIGMGGPEGRVYWPPGMEDWLRPRKRVVKVKDGAAEIKAPKKGKNESGEDMPVTEKPKVKVPKKMKAESTEDVAIPVTKKPNAARKKRAVPTASNSSDQEDFADEEAVGSELAQSKPSTRRASKRGRRKSYVEVDVSD